MRKYLTMYKGIEFQLEANSSYEAQESAKKHFQKSSRRKINGWDIIVVLADIPISTSSL